MNTHQLSLDSSVVVRHLKRSQSQRKVSFLENLSKQNSHYFKFILEAEKPTTITPVTRTPSKSSDTTSSVPAPPIQKPAAKPKQDPKAEIPKSVPVALPHDIVELEKLAETAANTAIKHYQKAVETLKA